MNIHELVEFLRQENAHDRVPPEREYVDYFVVCGGLGTRHIHTMANNLVAEVKGCGNGRGGRVRVEGRDSDEWMAIYLDQRKQYTIFLFLVLCACLLYVEHTYKFVF